MNEPPHESVWTPETSDDRAEVLAQLAKLLAHPLFSHSQRYPKFLRFLVEESLAGHEELLRERQLGVAVFGRTPDYDTTQDTIVRLTAAEVRKRIAQYYHDPAHRGQLQIDLRPGSYVPSYRWEGAASARAALETASLAGRLAADAGFYRLPRRWVWRAAGIAVLIGATCGVAWLLRQHAERQSAMHQLWAPILEDPGQVELVIADLAAPIVEANLLPAASSGIGDKLMDLLRTREVVNFRDSQALNGVTNVLAARRKPYALRLSSQASYTDLQHGPTVLIGGLDNVWTMRITAGLRYHFALRPGTYRIAIDDRQRAPSDHWSVDMSQPVDKTSEDYALIARIFDPTTGHPVLVAAGLGSAGTAAAARYLLDPEQIDQLAAQAPANWQHKNMEAVLRTRIIDNREGPPQLLECFFW